MAVFKSKHATGASPVASLLCGLVQGILFEYVTGATAPAANDIIEMGNIEPGVLPVDVLLLTDDLDIGGTPTMTLTVGILNAAGTDIDAAATSTWIAASTAAQTGGTARATSAAPYLSGASSAPRKLGIKVVAAPAAWAGAGKKLAVRLSATA